jgi:hypothetical protein
MQDTAAIRKFLNATKDVSKVTYFNISLFDNGENVDGTPKYRLSLTFNYLNSTTGCKSTTKFFSSLNSPYRLLKRGLTEIDENDNDVWISDEIHLHHNQVISQYHQFNSILSPDRINCSKFYTPSSFAHQKRKNIEFGWSAILIEKEKDIAIQLHYWDTLTEAIVLDKTKIKTKDGIIVAQLSDNFKYKDSK